MQKVAFSRVQKVNAFFAHLTFLLIHLMTILFFCDTIIPVIRYMTLCCVYRKGQRKK